MDAERQRVANLIKEAFRSVKLGNGVGLWEGRAIDDDKDDRTVAKHREGDEKNDWSAIPIKDINSCESSMSFFDPEGMRFHLPAFLLAELNGTLLAGVLFFLTGLNDFMKAKYVLLSGAQRHAVREFLLLLKDEPQYHYERSEVEKALLEYWKE